MQPVATEGRSPAIEFTRRCNMNLETPEKGVFARAIQDSSVDPAPEPSNFSTSMVAMEGTPNSNGTAETTSSVAATAAAPGASSRATRPFQLCSGEGAAAVPDAADSHWAMDRWPTARPPN